MSKNEKAELLLHPVRMRIIQTMISGEKTAYQIQECLPDVPPPTVYRQLQRLEKAGLIEVVSKKQVRGAVEKTFALVQNGAEITQEELARMTPDDHNRLFFTFMVNLLGDFEQYTAGHELDMAKDGAGFRQLSLYLTMEERLQLAKELANAANKYALNEPAKNRRRYTMASIFIPEAKRDPETTEAERQN